MKKWLIILGIITCMTGLTACGNQEQETETLLPEADAKELAENWAADLDMVAVTNSKNEYLSYYTQAGWDAAVLEGAVESWDSAAVDMGNYVEVVEVIENSMKSEVYHNEGYEDVYIPMEGMVSAKLKGSKHDAIIEIVYENYAPASVSTNIKYTTGESMARAGLNTLLGMGTVFAVLVLISFIIAAFGLIPKLFEPKKPVENKKADDIVSQIVEREELSDDTELVAVISAAIAAYEGSGSTDGFVVRSIRKTKNIKW